MIDDRGVETSLRSFRPVTRLPILTLRPPRTWPWALAAAVLLALALGLHGRPDVDNAAVKADDERVRVIRDNLADSPRADIVALWLAHREAMDEQRVRGTQESDLIDRMPELR